jgi:hypothetical protein
MRKQTSHNQPQTQDMARTITKLLETALVSVDVGGEQSREFAGEIRVLKQVLKLSRGLYFEHLFKYLNRNYFLVAGRNSTDPSPGAPYESWLYKGPLDFTKAIPIAFGSGSTFLDAISALELQAKQLKNERKIYEKVQGLDSRRANR